MEPLSGRNTLFKRHRTTRCIPRVGLQAVAACWAMCFCGFAAGIAQADAKPAAFDPMQGHSGQSVRQSAMQILPVDKLDAEGRAKVHAVLANVTIFRRMPVRVIDCDPDLYLFLVRHPDVVVNIWNVLKISQLQLRQTAPGAFRLKEESGITADLQYLYSSHDMHLIYAEGYYEGPMFGRLVKGSGLFLLKSGYIRETDGRYYISSRLDAFISIEPSAVEVVAKVLNPVIGATADNNFVQTVAFAGSLSRTTELNPRSVARLASQLGGLQPDVREQFTKLAEQIAKKPAAVFLREAASLKDAGRSETARNDDRSARR
jgi:hypothetical protein